MQDLRGPADQGRNRERAPLPPLDVRVLLVEDEPDLAGALCAAFEEEGYVCDVAEDGTLGLYRIENWHYDLVLLDLMLPGLDGRQLLGRLRRRGHTPVLVLTARDTTKDRVELLDLGADDYLTKPFVLEELLARARSLIRRSSGDPRPKVQVEDLEVDLVARVVARAGVRVDLTAREFALLELLVLRRGRVVGRSRILEHLWGDDEDIRSNVVEVHVSNLRRKLGHGLVVTRRGEGYMIDA